MFIILLEILQISCMNRFIEPVNYTRFYCFRLLDVAHGQRLEREMSLYLIFEHLYCDLSEYLADRPVLGDGAIKVTVFYSLFY